MQRLKGFTDSSFQTAKLPLETNEEATIRLKFSPTQYSWYFDIEYKNLISNGNKVVLGSNLLRAFKNIIPFGLAFKSLDGVDPFKLDDFIGDDPRVKIYLLNEQDVLEVERILYNE
jgi:hypothetical protein